MDPRHFFAGSQTTVDGRIPLPDDLAEGDYDLALWLPDASERLADDPRYAIRLANEGTWDEETGLNVLATVFVGEAAK